MSSIKRILIFSLVFCVSPSLKATSEVIPLKVYDPEFPLFNISTWKRSDRLDFIDEGIAPPVDVNSTTSPNDFLATNEASREFRFEVWIVVVLCCILLLAMRHANDFYSGDAVTLVSEGVWEGRYKHRGRQQKFLSHVERDFERMFEKIRTGEAEAQHRRLLKIRESADGDAALME